MTIDLDILLKKGARGAVVQALKDRLTDLGYGPLDANNPLFGDQTEKLVKRFQRDRLLNPDGEVGPLTWQRLISDRIPVVSNATTVSLVALEYGLSQLYVREKTGRNDGEDVEKYLRSVGLGKGYAWCVAFQYWNFQQAAVQLSIANPLPRTAGVLDMYNKIPKKFRVDTPEKGDLGFMDFGGGNGHMFLVKRSIGKKVNTIEGNTSADPTSSIEDRDGQGVYERLRPISVAKYCRMG